MRRPWAKIGSFVAAARPRLGVLLQVFVVVACLAAPALAHDPIERLQKGDLEGFADDALRTDWVVAVMSGGAAGIMAPVLARGLRQAMASETHLTDLKQALRECRDKEQALRSRYEAEQRRLKEIGDMVWWADWGVFGYRALQTTAEISSLGALILTAGAGAGAAFGRVAPVVARAMASSRAAITAAIAAAQNEGYLRGLRDAASARFGNAVQALQNLTAAQEASRSVLQAAQSEVMVAQTEMNLAVQKYSIAAQALTAAKEVALKGVGALAAAAGAVGSTGSSLLQWMATSAAAAGDWVRNCSLDFSDTLDYVRHDILKYDQAQNFKRQLADIHREYDRQMANMRNMGSEWRQQAIHCEGLAFRLASEIAEHKTALLEAKGAKEALDRAKAEAQARAQTLAREEAQVQAAAATQATTSPPTQSPPPPPAETKP